MEFNFDEKASPKRLLEFAEMVEGVSRQIGFKISSRGWCYQLEGFGMITKAQFDKVETWINECRKKGYLDIDFVAEEEGRQFSCVHRPATLPLIEDSKGWLEGLQEHAHSYTPDWWDGEDYYIQMIVEKIDLKTLFEPVCEKYHIPIATSKGWIVPMPAKARNLVTMAIEKYVGTGALDRFTKKRKKIVDEYEEFLDRSGLNESINNAMKIIENE